MALLTHDEIDMLTTVAWDTGQHNVLMLDFEKSEFDKPAVSWQFLTQNQLGEFLIDMNRKAFFAGGETATRAEKYSWDRNDSLETPLQLLKLIGHAIYHSCTAPEYFFSSQKIFYDSLLSFAVQELAGYQGA